MPARIRSVPASVRIGAADYAVLALDPDPRVARLAYRLRRPGDDTSYDVHVDEHGPQCQCLGFLRWNKPCKHILALRMAGLL